MDTLKGPVDCPQEGRTQWAQGRERNRLSHQGDPTGKTNPNNIWFETRGAEFQELLINSRA